MDMATQAELDAVTALLVAKSLYDANTVLAATADDTPAAVTMGASTILARLASGNIKAASVEEINSLLNLGIKDRTSALGWKAMSLDIATINTAANAMVTQRLLFLGQYLPAGLVITNLAVWLNNTPTSLTLAKLGLYQQVGQTAGAPTLVAATASQHGAWTGQGLKTAAVVAVVGGGAYTVPTSGLYYFAALAVCTGTVPNIMGFNGVANTDLLLPSGGFRYVGAQNSQTDLPSTAAVSAGISTLGIWVGAT